MSQDTLKNCNEYDARKIDDIKVEDGEWNEVKTEDGGDEEDCIQFEVIDCNPIHMLQCTKCDEYISPDAILTHICPIEYQENEMDSDDPSTALMICRYCNAIFDKNWKLQRHMVRIHNEVKTHVCNDCGKSFKQAYHLKEHLTSHTGEKNFACSICDKKFQRLSSVSRHMRSHDAAPGQKTKKTPYLCNICGKSFPFSNGAQRHMRIHLGIRRHECAICNRKFSQSTHLHVHMRTHTGEKPYVCDTCGESFSLKAAMRKHMAAVHKKNC